MREIARPVCTAGTGRAAILNLIDSCQCWRHCDASLRAAPARYERHGTNNLIFKLVACPELRPRKSQVATYPGVGLMGSQYSIYP